MRSLPSSVSVCRLALISSLLFFGPGIVRAADSSADSKGAADSKTAAPAFDPQLYQKTVDRGADYLLKSGMAEDGSYSAQISPAVTAICVDALLRSGRSPDDPAIAKSLKYLEGFVQPDGGIYKPGSAIQNYETSISIMCFAEANKDGRYKDMIKKAEDYVKNIQGGTDGKTDESAMQYGGAGYGRTKTRPDLSNTSFLLEALQSAGAESNDEAVQRALVFVSRCQNLESKYNTTKFAGKINDGGFYYTPADDGQSAPGGKSEDGGLRSYGSMTYAGLKSMIFAGLSPQDDRVKAAIDWVKKHYDLSHNPGMDQNGLYYYYHTMAKALSALKSDTFTDDKGVAHLWKVELIQELAKRQQDNGSWVNTASRFDEGDRNLVTSYALLSLSHCKPAGTK